MGWIAEYKTATQQAYGGYCNYIRDEGLTPVPYHAFQSLWEKVYHLPKKERKAELILLTRGY